jgi:hypothetical protein
LPNWRDSENTKEYIVKEWVKGAGRMDRRAKVQGASADAHSDEIAVGIGRRTPLRTREGGGSRQPEDYGAGMTTLYISNDFANDVRRCIRAWECQHTLEFHGVTADGEVKHFTGTVQTVDHDPQRADGRRWRVIIQVSTATTFSANKEPMEYSYELAKTA